MSRIQRLVTLLGIALAAMLMACERKSPAGGDSSVAGRPVADPEGERTTRKWTVGEKDSRDRLVIHLIDGETPIFLGNDFGVMLVNDGGWGIDSDFPKLRQPQKPRYLVAVRGTGKIVDTPDFAEFERALGVIPKGTRISRYDSCSVSRASHLPKTVWDKFEKAMLSAGLILEEDPAITCYCGGFR